MPSATDAKHPDLTAAEKALWLELIGRRCGLTFSDGRLRVLRQGLQARMQHHGIASFTDYYHAVSCGRDGDAEWPLLLDLLLNKETSFFRHPPSFELLTAGILPELMRLRYPQGENLLRLWSAGCSIGQEAYSLAMAFVETAGSHGWKVQVTGSDLSPNCLERGRRGRYKPYELREVPEPYGTKYLRVVEEHGEALHEVDAGIRNLVQFLPCNLLDADSYAVPPQDVIFCQNVLIYFSADSRREVVRMLSERLRNGGYLFFGPAEVVGAQAPNLEPLRRNNVLVYRRTG
jgi:chemotaxis methyl-accepting protein methylase